MLEFILNFLAYIPLILSAITIVFLLIIIFVFTCLSWAAGILEDYYDNYYNCYLDRYKDIKPSK